MLSDAERALAPRPGPRRDEWIAGRIAIRRALGEVFGAAAAPASALIDHDGAPLVVGAPPCALSLSHDGDHVAVAIAEGAARAGVDLCLREHAERIARILARLGATTDVDPCVAWAALEATLKLRRLPVLALRDRALAVVGAGELEVRGLGAPARVSVRDGAELVVAWTVEA